jgi:hypothetical protein
LEKIVLYFVRFLFFPKFKHRRTKLCPLQAQKFIMTEVVTLPYLARISGTENVKELPEEKQRIRPKLNLRKRIPKAKNLPKRERKSYIADKLKESFQSKDDAKAYVERNLDRKKTNAIKRLIRLDRKVNLQQWNYFVTFTYSNELHTEESFRAKLSNTLKHLVSRKGWKYIGVWERSPEKQRLHFHGIFYIPENAMIGELTEVSDYSTKTHRRQTTFQNSHFLKFFGRNDFKEIVSEYDVRQSVRYLVKYIEKSGEKLIYGGKLPTYFVSDVLDEDLLCPYGIEDKKWILADHFTCIDQGEIMGEVSSKVIEQMPKAN